METKMGIPNKLDMFGGGKPPYGSHMSSPATMLSIKGEAKECFGLWSIRQTAIMPFF